MTLRETIEAFLTEAAQPVLLEPGVEAIPLLPGRYEITERTQLLHLSAWSDTARLHRKITAVTKTAPGKLSCTAERFAKQPVTITLVDLARPQHSHESRRSQRRAFAEQFRAYLRRQFPTWTLAALSAEPDLEHTLSPNYPRALLKSGQNAWAAMGASEDSEPDGALTFGLIWLDYLRQTKPKLSVQGLVLFLPRGQEETTRQRLAWLGPQARYQLYVYADGYCEERTDLADRGNLVTSLEPCERPVPLLDTHWSAPLGLLPYVDTVSGQQGTVSWRVRGVEFARRQGVDVRYGLETKTKAEASHLPEILALAAGLQRMRDGQADRGNPLYQRQPELWLESAVRRQLSQIDGQLREAPVYGQVPAVVGRQTGIVDLLAVQYDGRLVVIELKASADLHLPLQALDYWMRVRWHAERSEFAAHGFFPGIQIRRDAPRLLLVAPALEFHPSTEAILRYWSPDVPVERIGVGAGWRTELQVMFRYQGAQVPQSAEREEKRYGGNPSHAAGQERDREPQSE